MTLEAREHRAPAVLLPYQQRWVADHNQVKVCEKSRRVGLSWAAAAECALLAASQRGQDCWYVGYNKDMAQEFIRDSADWAKHYQLAAAAVEETVIDDEDKQILAFVIRFSSGFRITALSSRPSNLRGKQGYVILDEAAFHERLDELLKAALALLMWGGRVAVISTHDGVENPFNELVQEVRSGRRPFSLHRITLDDALHEGLYRRICLRRGIEWSEEGERAWRKELIEFYGSGADEELFCIPRNSGGAYLPRSLLEERMYPAPVARLELEDGFAQLDEPVRVQRIEEWCEEVLAPLLDGLDRKTRHALGEDFGRVSDLTVLVPVAIEQNLSRRIPFMIELRNVPFRAQEQILFYVIDRLPRFQGAAMDATGNGAYLAEVAAQRYGERVKAINLSEGWYAEHFPRLKASLEDGELSIPRDADVLDDLRAVQVINGVPKLPPLRKKASDGKARHGDAAVAILLADYASRQDSVAYGYTPVPKHSAGDTTHRTVRATSGWRAGGGIL